MAETFINELGYESGGTPLRTMTEAMVNELVADEAQAAQDLEAETPAPVKVKAETVKAGDIVCDTSGYITETVLSVTVYGHGVVIDFDRYQGLYGPGQSIYTLS